LDQIVEIEGRLAEEFVDPLRFELEQIPLNRARARGGNVAVLRLKLVGVVRNVLQRRTKILQKLFRWRDTTRLFFLGNEPL
jgi:hypothetical protein